MSDYLKLSYKKRRAMLAQAVARHGWRCIICGLVIAPADRRPGRVHLEHRVPRSQGGDNSAENTGPAHAKCNLSRGARPLAVKVVDGSQFFE